MAQPPVYPNPWASAPLERGPNLPGGLVIAGMWRRFGAYLLDAFILFAVGFAVSMVMDAVGLWTTRAPDTAKPLEFEYNYPALLISLGIGMAVSSVYFVYSWTRKRATPGQMACSLQVGDVATGNNLTMDQAVKRWVALEAASALVTIVMPVQSLYLAASLLLLAWYLALLITTATHPMRRGLHDRFAGSLVVWQR
jgi:uncharacterized RDD family membrane protein YckC